MAIEQTSNTGRFAFSRTTALPAFTSYTICGWFKWLSVVNTWQGLFGLTRDQNEYHSPYITMSDAILRAQVMHNASFTDGVMRTLALNTWYFVALRGNATQLTGSVILAGETAVTSGVSVAVPTGPPVEFEVLGNVWDPEYFIGRAAHLKIYDVVLSDAELLAEMVYAPVRTANLNAYYPLTTVATAATDTSGNARPLTVSGTGTLIDTVDVPPDVTAPTTSQVFTIAGSQTWTWPTGVTSVTAEALGGGGGSGTASGNPATGGGGKGGSYAKATITKGAETQLTLVVGAGGALAAAGAASSVTQGGTTVLLASGGGGGATQASSSANGAGGTTVNGTAVGSTIFAGGNGGTGNFTSGTAGSGAGGGAAGPTSVGGAASVNVAGTKGTGTFLNGVAYSGAGAAGVGNTLPGLPGPTGTTSYGGGASGGKAVTNTDQVGAAGRQGVVVLTWTPPPFSLTRLSQTGEVRVSMSPSVSLTLTPAPAVGQGVVVVMTGYRNTGMTFGPCADNQGNAYTNITERRVTANGAYAIAIFVCAKVTTTGTPFTITISGGAAGDYYVGAAWAVGGLGSNVLGVTTYTNNSGSGTAVSTNPTPTVTGDALIAAGFVKYQTATSIVVEALTPAWTVESTELDGTNWIPSEVDSRLATLSGAVQGNWTIAPTGSWAAAIVVCQAAAPAAAAKLAMLL